MVEAVEVVRQRQILNQVAAVVVALLQAAVALPQMPMLPIHILETMGHPVLAALQTVHFFFLGHSIGLHMAALAVRRVLLALVVQM